MTDKKTCSVSESKTTLFIFIDGNGISSVSLFSHDFPGESSNIRVGNSKAITIPYDHSLTASRARNFVKKLKPGVVVKSRWYDWPHDIPKEGKTVINNGFQVALNYAYTQLGLKVTKTVSLPRSSKKRIKNTSNAHSHNGRSHSHRLPKQGKAHRHGNGAVGR